MVACDSSLFGSGGIVSLFCSKAYAFWQLEKVSQEQGREVPARRNVFLLGIFQFMGAVVSKESDAIHKCDHCGWKGVLLFKRPYAGVQRAVGFGMQELERTFNGAAVTCSCAWPAPVNKVGLGLLKRGLNLRRHIEDRPWPRTLRLHSLYADSGHEFRTFSRSNVHISAGEHRIWKRWGVAKQDHAFVALVAGSECRSSTVRCWRNGSYSRCNITHCAMRAVDGDLSHV